MWRNSVPQLGFPCPFVLQLLLGVSALHLARILPADSARFWRLAESRASVGIRQLTELLPTLRRENCGALFLTTTLVLVFSLAKGPSPTDKFLVANGAEVPWWQPLRGVRLILDTMGPDAVFSGSRRPRYPAEQPPRPRIQPLITAASSQIVATALFWEEALWEVSDLIAVSPSPHTEMFQRTFEELAGCFRETFGTPEEPRKRIIGRFEVIVAWLYRLEDDFTLQVGQQHPVALVLLAHFAMLLQTMEYAWFVEGWVGHIIRRVTEILGVHFAECLKWPTATIRESSRPWGAEWLSTRVMRASLKAVV
ncbi:hypothetical protein VTI74DRAFT_1894 [Chaetomium olivicolor]